MKSVFHFFFKYSLERKDMVWRQTTALSITGGVTLDNLLSLALFFLSTNEATDRTCENYINYET